MIALACFCVGFIPVAFLSGCSTTPGETWDGPSEAIGSAVIQYAVLEYIDGDAETAERILAVTDALQGNTTSLEAVTIDALVAAARDTVPWEAMTPPQIVLANQLIGFIEGQIRRRVDVGQLSPESLASVDLMIGWISQAASLSLAGETPVSLGLPPIT